MGNSKEPSARGVMSETGEVSFVSAQSKPREAAAPTDARKPKKPEKSWAQLKAERDSLDQEMAREIAELGAMPKALRRARRLLDYLLVYGTAVVVAAMIYALATIVWPSKAEEDTRADLGVSDAVDEEVGSMMDARRRLMRGQQRSASEE